MTAAPQDQWRLLDVQAHDTRLAQIAHRRRTLPEHAELEELAKRVRLQADELVAGRTLVADVSRELTKAEADVEQVRQRAARDKARMDAGKGSAKDLLALQHEVETLAARRAVLEDIELDVMERLEQAEGAVTRLEAAEAELATRTAEVTARRDAELAALDAEAVTERRSRDDAAAGLPADLLALYEKIRSANAGVGAARLYQRRCEGCRLELNATDLSALRAAAENAVVRCEECGRILVRTADSGL